MCFLSDLHIFPIMCDIRHICPSAYGKSKNLTNKLCANDNTNDFEESFKLHRILYTTPPLSWLETGVNEVCLALPAVSNMYDKLCDLSYDSENDSVAHTGLSKFAQS